MTQSPGANFAAALRAPSLGAIGLIAAGGSADGFERSLGIAADSCQCPPTALRENRHWRCALVANASSVENARKYLGGKRISSAKKFR